MPNFIQITIIGHLGRDASTKEVGSSSVTEFSVAVTPNKRNHPDLTNWFRCSYWGKRAANAAPYLIKGKPVLVTGSLTIREFTRKDGTVGTSNDVDIDDFVFLGDGGGSPQGRDDAPSAAPAEDEIPF